MGPPSYYHLRLGTNAYSKDVYSTDGTHLQHHVRCVFETILLTMGCSQRSISPTLPRHIARKLQTYTAEDAVRSSVYMTFIARPLTPVYFTGNVQIDDPGLAYFCDVNMVKGMKDQGLDPDYLLNLYIQAYKDCLSEKPAGMNIGLHLCRGNYTVSLILVLFKLLGANKC